MTRSEQVRKFADLVRRPEAEVDLGRAAFAIAAGAYPGLDAEEWVGKLHDLAKGVDDLADLRKRLFGDLGFRGDTVAYYDSENSFLNRVMERRRGIPITLAVLMMEVGRYAGITLEGIGMPGHFLVRSPGAGVYIDPFDRGEILDERGCEHRFRASVGAGEEVAFGPEMLPVVSKRDILRRMLTNLQQIYRGESGGEELEWITRMKLALPGTPAGDVIVLAESLARQGRTTEAASEIESAAALHPELDEQLRGVANAMRASLN